MILEKNIFGLDIDDRAAQLARFSLLMRARKDDKRILRKNKIVNLSVLAIQESNSFKTEEFDEVDVDFIEELLHSFKDAKTLGSLIEISESLVSHLDHQNTQATEILNSIQQSFEYNKIIQIKRFIKQAKILSSAYDAVIANPPYLGRNGLNANLKKFAQNMFPNSKNDLFAMFIERGFKFLKVGGFNSMVTMQSWMFLSSYKNMRLDILKNKTIECLSHMGNGVMRIAFGTNATVFRNTHLKGYQSTYSYTELTDINDDGEPNEFPVKNNRLNYLTADDFHKIPGSPIAYWASDSERKCFGSKYITDFANIKSGLLTGRDELFVRQWFEVSVNEIHFELNDAEKIKELNPKWLPETDGGDFRKWYGNLFTVVNSFNNFDAIKTLERNNYRLRDSKLYFKKAVNWPKISNSYFGAKLSPEKVILGNGVRTGFIKDPSITSEEFVISYLSSILSTNFLKLINPTLAFNNENIAVIPFNFAFNKVVHENGCRNIQISKSDWDSMETSWDFTEFPLLDKRYIQPTIASTYSNLRIQWNKITNEMRELEIENNRIFIEAYKLSKEHKPDVPLKDITLHCNPSYRFDEEKNEKELESLLQNDTIKQLLSYSVGCMMGRYSLDKPGLMYANKQNERFDKSAYQKFPVDDDGIVTITDIEDLIIRDDLTDRFVEFVHIAWGKDSISENLKFIADALGLRTNELPKETIRRWVSTEFFKDHLQRYKNRPIYWLFSSGKKKAFEALVYLHRYNDGTLSRMRMKYVVPLQSRINGRLKTIEDDIASASSAQERNKLNRLKKVLVDKELELREYDETLRHLAEQQIKLDLDDGVKVNYGIFPGLLAETKKVCGN